ncbi:hypothetical protein DNTS_018478 [Danionella cerebrum]|uniref:Vezatin n=1 Tax=Danionella cerebrum TaxID=2873325 RepID=A0A553MYX6_9TELE|nr:hypothetical protein DNTS_018478 [Danionella translucida]TRY58384.1 hypothetical protein DNTS_018478 [Danionella translucida]
MFPLNSEIDNVTNYVSTVPIKELGLGLGSELLSDEEAQELTNGYSLPGLKMLFQLWLGQSSEFFRRLALLLSPVHEGSGSPAQLGYKSVPLITDTLQRTLEASLADLQRSFSFHRELQSQQVQRQSLQPQGSISQKRMKDREMELLHSSVRSLQLHLKTLLHEVIIAEDDLDKMTEQNASKESCQEDIQDLLEELQERLRMLEPHVQACSSCWEHTISQLENLLRPKARTNTNSDRDPVPEEQELEAYVSDSDSDSERGFGADISSLSELQRRGRDESKQVLLELKTVLGFRASHDERDKRKRMLFSEHAALVPCAKDTSESAPNEMDTSLMPLNNKLNHEETEPKTQEPDGVTEFICGDSEVCRWDKKDERPAETLLFQSDGLADQGNDGIHSFKVPSLSVMDRLVDLHGSEVVSFASALAAQVAARSCDFTSMKESTYGDSENEEEVTSPEESRESEGE